NVPPHNSNPINHIWPPKLRPVRKNPQNNSRQFLSIRHQRTNTRRLLSQFQTRSTRNFPHRLPSLGLENGTKLPNFANDFSFPKKCDKIQTFAAQQPPSLARALVPPFHPTKCHIPTCTSDSFADYLC